MQSKSKGQNQGEPILYSTANSAVCAEPWWKNKVCNSLTPTMMQGNGSDSSSLEQSEGGIYENNEDAAKQSPINKPTQQDRNKEDLNSYQAATIIHPYHRNLSQPPQLELVGHSNVYGANHCDPCYGGMMAAYGPPVVPHIYDLNHTRIPLTPEMAQETVFVNPKQYQGILRRRQSRAKAELEKKLIKDRKPYLHESRHLHAMRRQRGAGGRFAKKSSSDTSNRGTKDSDMCISSQSTHSKCDSAVKNNLYSTNGGNFFSEINMQELKHQSSAGNLGEGFNSTHWGNLLSNHKLAMQ